MQKKTYINIAFHNFKIIWTQNQTSVVSVLSVKVQNCKLHQNEILE